MKRVNLFSFRMLLILSLPLVLCAAGKREKSDSPYKIGIAKIIAQPALDAVEEGVVEVLKKRFPRAHIDIQNANGDTAAASGIAKKFKGDRVDIAIGISTPMSIALATVLEKTPVIYTAVTDPVVAGLVPSYDKGGKWITGVSDRNPVRTQILYLQMLMPRLKRLGHIYTSSEVNAILQAEEAEAVAKELGMEFIATTITTSAEVKQATLAIIDRVDAIYISSDSTLEASIPSVASVAKAKKIPLLLTDVTVAKEVDQVLLALGFDFKKIGTVTGELVVDVLEGRPPRDIPTQFLTDPGDLHLYYNADLAAKLESVGEIPDSLMEKVDFVTTGGKYQRYTPQQKK